MNYRLYISRARTVSFAYILIAMLCILLVGCDVTINTDGKSNGGNQCQSNCTTGSGAQGVRVFVVFFFNDTATTEIYTLSLHDALPISEQFKFYEKEGLKRGFKYVESGPLVRSSYHAEKHINALKKS